MIGNNYFFSTFLDDYNVGKVTLGNGEFAKTYDKGIIEHSCMLKLEEVLYIACLNENLLNISQLFNMCYKVNFSKEGKYCF